MRLTLTAAAGGLLVAVGSAPAVSGEVLVTVEIPRLNVSEYHRPYVAVWLEGQDQKVTNLAVWYDLNLKNGEGTKWLKDMRQWWRRSGRELSMPVDGLSGATRAPGRHQVALATDAAPLAALVPGEYTLVVEAAREVGGRELLRVPFQWPAPAALSRSAKGETELAGISLDLKP